MIHVFLVFFIFIALIFIMGLSVYVGRTLGRLQLQKYAEHKLEGISVAETAIFSLLALLVAFTFSGAYERYENRKLHILEEANVFDTAYEYIDLTPVKYQPILRKDVRQYLDLHLASYNDIPNMMKVDQDLYKAIDIQHEIWKSVIAACKDNPNIAQLVIPAMSNMFDVTHTGINMARIHPPGIIFILLISLASLGSILVGYNSAANKQKHPIHILSYVLLTSFTIYIIMNIEYPRVGFVRLSTFDQMLKDVRDDMN